MDDEVGTSPSGPSSNPSHCLLDDMFDENLKKGFCLFLPLNTFTNKGAVICNL